MTTTAEIIDQHRQDGRRVGYGVTVCCACGAEPRGYIDSSRPIDGENNSHRVADRKHAAHVADMLAAQEPTEAEVEAVQKCLYERTLTWMPMVEVRAALSAARAARRDEE